MLDGSSIGVTPRTEHMSRSAPPRTAGDVVDGLIGIGGIGREGGNEGNEGKGRNIQSYIQSIYHARTNDKQLQLLHARIANVPHTIWRRPSMSHRDTMFNPSAAKSRFTSGDARSYLDIVLSGMPLLLFLSERARCEDIESPTFTSTSTSRLSGLTIPP